MQKAHVPQPQCRIIVTFSSAAIPADSARNNEGLGDRQLVQRALRPLFRGKLIQVGEWARASNAPQPGLAITEEVQVEHSGVGASRHDEGGPPRVLTDERENELPIAGLVHDADA
eukprot:6586701-Prymnesium_polylepis.2